MGQVQAMTINQALGTRTKKQMKIFNNKAIAEREWSGF